MQVDLSSPASISPCERFRFWLRRNDAALSGPPVVFVMLNPSTADAIADDPTIRRCLGFARRWRHQCFGVVNLFSLRATDPRQLKARLDEDREARAENDEWILEAAFWARDHGGRVVAAWGAHGDLDDRAEEVRDLLGRPLFRIGPSTARGHPRHPLYLRGSLPLEHLG